MPRPRTSAFSRRQHRADRDRQVAQRFQLRGFLFVVQMSAHLRQRQGQQEQRGQLRGEGLGRGDADFDPGAGDQRQHAIAHHGAGGDVADGQRIGHALRPRVL
jgi:hypothetical protein